jgi:hypothetical protein
MSTPMFSVLHETNGRPEKAFAAMRMFHNRAKAPEDVEYIFAVNLDDPSLLEFKRLYDEASIDESLNFKFFSYVLGHFKGSAPAWNAAYEASEGAILIQGQDDIEPPELWDVTIKGLAQGHGGEDWRNAPFSIAVSDGYRKDALCCTAIMSRAYAETEGHFLYPEYTSVFSDDDFTIRAIANAADGRAQFIQARDVVLKHEHHYHNKEIPFDATYERENSAKAYSSGERIFMERNKRLIERGFKTW